MHKKKLKSIFQNYVKQRNKRIVKMRRQGKSLKWLASKFGLTGRQVSRVLAR